MIVDSRFHGISRLSGKVVKDGEEVMKMHISMAELCASD